VVADAVVKALNVASGRESSIKTDSSGKYQLSELLPGSYRISVASPGFATAARTVTLRNHETARQDFSLAPGALEDSITVTAGRGSARVVAETPQTITVANENDMRCESRPCWAATVPTWNASGPSRCSRRWCSVAPSAIDASVTTFVK
jgi:hypothetical protein